MNRYKLVSTGAAAVIMIAGCVYLALGSDTLGIVLAICSLSLIVMGGANAAEQKKSGIKGLPAYIPAICFGVLAAFIAAAAVYWYIST